MVFSGLSVSPMASLLLYFTLKRGNGLWTTGHLRRGRSHGDAVKPPVRHLGLQLLGCYYFTEPMEESSHISKVED